MCCYRYWTQKNIIHYYKLQGQHCRRQYFEVSGYDYLNGYSAEDTLYRYYSQDNSMMPVYKTQVPFQFIADLFAAGNSLFFTEYYDHQTGSSIYALNGREVTEIGGGGGPTVSMMEVQNQLFQAVYADYYISGYEVSDGTQTGTRTIESFDQTVHEYGTEEVFNYQDKFIFFGRSRNTEPGSARDSYELKVYNLSTDTSYFVEDLYNNIAEIGFPKAANFREVGGVLFFTSRLEDSLRLYSYIPEEIIITKVKNSVKELDVAIFPNPGTDFITVTANIYNLEATATDLLGQTLTLPIIDNKINVTELKAGIYLMNIKSESAEKTIKFIKY